MCTYKEHLQQAGHNLKVASLLSSQDPAAYPDWVVTACFYSGVHCAEAAFFKIPTVVHTETACPTRNKHDYRQKMVGLCFPMAAQDYRILRNLSQTARYKAATWISVEDAAQSSELVEHIRREMKLPALG